MFGVSIPSDYDLTRNVMMGLYAVEDPSGALDAVFSVSLFAGVPVVDASVWFPRWGDDFPGLHLADDVYSSSALRTLFAQITALLPGGGSPLESASRAVEFSQDPIRLGFASAVSPLVSCAALASCVGDPVDGDAAVLLAVGRPGGELVHLLRFRAGPFAADAPLSSAMSDVARRLARYACGVADPRDLPPAA